MKMKLRMGERLLPRLARRQPNRRKNSRQLQGLVELRLDDVCGQQVRGDDETKPVHCLARFLVRDADLGDEVSLALRRGGFLEIRTDRRGRAQELRCECASRSTRVEHPP